jgi:malonyl-CoA/methylmalonyl-CoA synthetase
VLLTTESGKTYTYEDAEIKSAQMANYLASLGLLPGDRVTVQVESFTWPRSGPEWFFTH